MDIGAARAKREGLSRRLLTLGTAAVAFSGGVDSTFLLAECQKALGPGTLAVTGRSLSFPARELEAATRFAEGRGIRHRVVDSEELAEPGFADNPPDRCYLCKRGLFSKIRAVADEEGARWILEASNLDDEGDYRPGLKAAVELGVLSPLREVRLAKAEIRALSREAGLPTWDKPSFACLASRFPYGERITPEALARVDRAEEFLMSLGARQVRVRLHEKGTLARIETDDDGMRLLSGPAARERAAAKLKELGFKYVAMDLAGYRTGSMNLTLPPGEDEEQGNGAGSAHRQGSGGL
ncbi:MAG: ATP-dependent sacrificial sulfur transferase LarE [Deltaproteobacteria bacterium]|nr:ATP-dependent sacrificial sulfur transferase LarE [Deltaproteobacteria bacterium]